MKYLLIILSFAFFSCSNDTSDTPGDEGNFDSDTTFPPLMDTIGRDTTTHYTTTLDGAYKSGKIGKIGNNIVTDIDTAYLATEGNARICHFGDWYYDTVPHQPVKFNAEYFADNTITQRRARHLKRGSFKIKN